MKLDKILVAQAQINNIDLLNIPLKDIQEKVKDALAYKLAKEIVKSDSCKITEELDFSSMTKKYKVEVEVAVISKEEYQRLKEIEAAAAGLVKSMFDIV